MLVQVDQVAQIDKSPQWYLLAILSDEFGWQNEDFKTFLLNTLVFTIKSLIFVFTMITTSHTKNDYITMDMFANVFKTDESVANYSQLVIN